MKSLIILSSYIVGLFFTPIDNYSVKSSGLNLSCNTTPKLNKQIIEFVNSKIKKRVGRGECWDLAAEALQLTNAKWNGKYKYGKEVFYQSECIFPGDIMQFEGVKVKYVKDGFEYKEKMSHHTAIIHEVKGKGNFVLAHQNTVFSGRKVGLSTLELKNITKGKFKIYRPIKK
jgi:hypothetical protein